MQYMTFPVSCAYCCAANLLEQYGIPISDRALALKAKLPWRLEYDRATDSFLAGAMLQAPRHFDLALNPLGFSFQEEIVPKNRVLELHEPFMIGVDGEFGKHAMVCLGETEGGHRFLNPHREGDGQPDHQLFSREELLSRLSAENHVGRLVKIAPKEPDILPLGTETLVQYHQALCDFFRTDQNREILRKRRDPLLRPIALDWPAMMELAGEEALLEKLRRFQQQVFSLFQTDGCVPMELLDMSLLEEIFKDYGAKQADA